jgi:hypothetical protein
LRCRASLTGSGCTTKSLAPGKCSPSSGRARTGFYTDAIEIALNEHVEKPANVVLERIRQGGDITLAEAERVSLTVYIATMMKGVPDFRNEAEFLCTETRYERCYIEPLYWYADW